MVYDDSLAARVRSALADHAPAEEKSMFGGLAFMIEDHMACAMMGDDLLVRVGADGHEDARRRGARAMVMKGRTMTGFMLVPGADLADPEVLGRWVEQGAQVARSLPPKAPRPVGSERSRPRGTAGH